MIKKTGAWIKRHPIWSVLITLFLLFILYNIIKPEQPEYEYLTEAVVKGDIVRNVSASGKVRALNTINVGAEVSGQITQVFVDYNSPVTKGQVLAVIDPTRVGAQVNQGQAQVALAQAGLQQAQANAQKHAATWPCKNAITLGARRCPIRAFCPRPIWTLPKHS
ncbi:MAG: biotin/lipoyl-binding protein [Sphingomonadales bacterium]|nr:biotin/lipoyl-binding protein [Sphingomonadales bacterium]